MKKEYQLYANVEKLALKVIVEERKIYKGVSANVDFYSGFVYQMLGLPTELFTPLFAVARMAGWNAHRIEELINQGKSFVLRIKQLRNHSLIYQLMKDNKWVIYMHLSRHERKGS